MSKEFERYISYIIHIFTGQNRELLGEKITHSFLRYENLTLKPMVQLTKNHDVLWKQLTIKTLDPLHFDATELAVDEPDMMSLLVGDKSTRRAPTSHKSG